jgi:hypothetical protein
MADTKISALTQLTGAGSTADTDELVLVDKSDTTMAASGTDKRVTMVDLASAVFERPLADFTNTTPTGPAAGLKLFSRNRPAGRRIIGTSDSDGRDMTYQPAAWNNTQSWLLANGNSTTVSSSRIAATAIGTATAATWATTNLRTSMRRISYISAGTAGSSGGVKYNTLHYWRGNAAGLGGFFFSCRFSFALLPAGYRFFVGMYGSATNPTNADISTQLNLIGVGKDAADTAPQFMHNDGTATALKTSTALALPTTSDVLEVRVFCKPNDTVISMSCQYINGGTAAMYTSGTTDLPASTQGLLPMLWANNGVTASAIDPELLSMYLETDL